MNLVATVPSYSPLESDEIKSNILYKAPKLKKSRSATNSVVKKKAATTLQPSDAAAQLYGLYLTEREIEHLTELSHSTVFVRTKNEITVFEVVERLREYGFIKVNKEHETAFWCTFSDITNEESIAKTIASIRKKHGKVF